MLSTERYTGEMKVMWDKKQAKRRQRRMESRKKAAAAAAARGERPPTPPGEKRPDSADALTYVHHHNLCHIKSWNQVMATVSHGMQTCHVTVKS